MTEQAQSHYQGPGSAAEHSTRQYATFHVKDLFLGIEVVEVQEVLRYQEMTRVPLAPPLVEGLINLRGQIVTAIDMRRRLKLAPRDGSEFPMNMVVRGDESAVSLLVDEIGDVLSVRQEDFELPPENISPDLRETITGVYKLDGKLMLVLDTGKVLQVQNHG